MEKNNTTSESTGLSKLLHTIMANQQLLADAVGIELSAVTDGTSTALAGTTSKATALLSRRLRMRMLCPAAFERAVSEGWLSADGGHGLTWSEGRTLLAYFLGRLFCNDKAVYSKTARKYIWRQRGPSLPAKELKELFGFQIKTLRTNRKNMTAPENFHIVDKWF